jgi:plasmid maintenance system antidote protein VapI
MKSILEYLNELKEITGSDYKSAKLLQITKESVSKIRSRGQLSDETAIKMADLLEIDRDELLIAAAIARSEGTAKEAWINHAKRFGIAASILIASSLTPTFTGLATCILC